MSSNIQTHATSKGGTDGKKLEKKTEDAIYPVSFGRRFGRDFEECVCVDSNEQITVENCNEQKIFKT